MDFRFDSDTYFDIVLYGEIWDRYCNPEAISYDEEFSTIDNSDVPYTPWRNLKWKPHFSTGPVPELFIPITYKVIEYDDKERSNILQEINGSININDSYLIDEHGFYISKINSYTQNSSVYKNQNFQVSCQILQPRSSTLVITAKKLPAGSTDTLYNQSLNDEIRLKNISINHVFTTAGQNELKFTLTTSNLNYMDSYCVPTIDYVEQVTSTITVEEPS